MNQLINIFLGLLCAGAMLVLAWFSHPNEAFYVSAAVALFATVMVVLNTSPVHALLYLVLSFLAVAAVFYTLGAAFAAALEIIVYAGAILVLFVFVVMMLNLGHKTSEQERRWLSVSAWAGPALLSGVLLWQLLTVLWPHDGYVIATDPNEVTAKMVGVALYGPYLLAVELASMLLLAGLVAAYHLGKNE